VAHTEKLAPTPPPSQEEAHSLAFSQPADDTSSPTEAPSLSTAVVQSPAPDTDLPSIASAILPTTTPIVQDAAPVITPTPHALPLTPGKALEPAAKRQIINDPTEEVSTEKKQDHPKGSSKRADLQQERRQPSTSRPLSTEPAEKQAFGWTPPRGVRAFHPHIPPPIDNSPIHAGSHQSTVDRLFDPRQQGTVKFKDFKSLWLAIGGSIIANPGGSSHHALVSPAGQKVGSIFSKGGGTIYGKVSIQYLRDAALRVGLRPTTLSKNL
jgi:hypothetical protein